MALPPLAPFPPAHIRTGMMPEEWELCLGSWITLTKLHLQSPDTKFGSLSVVDGSLVDFLSSYVHETSQTRQNHVRLAAPSSEILHRTVFLLCHRFLSYANPIPSSLLKWTFLADLSAAYPRTTGLKSLMSKLWSKRRKEVEPVVTGLKASTVESLESRSSRVKDDPDERLRQLTHFIPASPGIASFFMIGSDFLDALSAAYGSSSATLRRRIVAVTYTGLISLTEGETTNLSLLFDHLYMLKASSEKSRIQNRTADTLLLDLISRTPILLQLQDRVRANDAARANALFAELQKSKDLVGPKSQIIIRKKLDKRKGHADDTGSHEEYENGAFGHLHVHRMSLITQVQDLFPDLGSGFVVKLLDEYGDVEQVTAHLLDGSLSPHLKVADRSQQL